MARPTRRLTFRQLISAQLAAVSAADQLLARLQEVAPFAVLSDWELQGRAAPRAAWRSFPQLAGSLLGRDNLPSPSICHEVRLAARPPHCS